MMFLWWLGIIAVGFFVWRYMKTNGIVLDNESEAHKILKERLAKGEITVEDYNELKSKL